jgi:protein O-GlcNAc transferase
MGIFDRFRSTGQAVANSSMGKTTLSEQDAARLIDDGHALEAQGRLDEAMQCYLNAIRLAPNPARAHLNHGNVLLLKGDLEGALDAFRTAIKHKPDYAGAYYNMGNALLDNDQLDEAVASYHRALEIQPDYAEVHCSLGVALHGQRRLEDAATCHKRALELKPDLVEAHSNLGNVLQALSQFESAVACYRRALEFKPDNAEVLCSLGIALKVQGKFTEAEASIKQALEIEPDNAKFRVALIFRLPIAPQTVADSVAVTSDFDRSLQDLSDWMLSAPEQRKHFSEALGFQNNFYLAYRDGNHAARLSCFGDWVTPSSDKVRFESVPKRKKLRLVVVSKHFHRHSVWDIILRGILVNLDRSRFEVVLYNMGSVEDEETTLAKSLCDIWRDFRTITGLNGWLDAMAADQPDAIFYPETGMDEMTLRLATRRLAPLQVASWGHPITTGLPTIDLFFSGEMIEAPEADTHYCEQLVRLPGTGCCTTPIRFIPDVLHELSAELAKRPGTRFVIPQMPFKFDPADDALFANIATTVGKCTFILLSDPQFSWITEQLIARINRAFHERNLDPAQHLLVIPWLSLEKFYALLDLCDIYLDCPAFSGYTTAWQAVQRGLPIVTLEGRFMRQRLAAGLLRKIGMTDTIAASKVDYIEIAARLAAECRDPNRRDARRSALKVAAPQMDNDVSVVRAFEQSLIKALAERGRHFDFDVTGQRTSNLSQPSKA